MGAVKLTGEHFEHVSEPAERWDLLAFRYYGDAMLQRIIMEANRHLWLDDLASIPPVLPSRTRLKIPVIERSDPDPAQLPPWKREVAA